MSKLSAKIAAVERAEKELLDFLKSFYCLPETETAILLDCISKDAHKYLDSTMIWIRAFDEMADVYAPNGIPRAEIERLSCHWRELREVEREALLKWKSLCVTTT